MGGFVVRETGVSERVTGTTLAGLATGGDQTLFQLVGPERAELWLAYVEWDCSEREIRRTRRHETPWLQDRALGRPRIEIEAWGEGFLCMELGRVPVEEEDDLRVAQASEFELDMAARVCIRCALQIAGATAMGTRQEVLGVCDDRRHHLCTTFPVGARLVPAVVFALTRVAPLLHGDPAERV